ncbi:LysE family translocator [Serratia bockelmannii]|uniref:LysE family translocator n=1 Tax=Serratia bockelmannii TaxID=2703793 RepID=UPI00313CD28F
MPDSGGLLVFASISLGLVLTPGPNMLYLISRSLCQGKRAGLISLLGVAMGFVFYMLLAVFGITAILFAIPYAYELLKLCGVAYLVYLAWGMLKPGGRSVFILKNLSMDSSRKLFMMGFATNVANPKIAIMYLSLLPQFISENGSNLLSQTLVLGLLQITISVFVNALIVLTASKVSVFMNERPLWQRFQRWLMGAALLGMAAKIMSE